MSYSLDLTSQTEMLSVGISWNDVSPHTFDRSSKLIEPSKKPDAVYQLEVVYYNVSATPWVVSLIAPDTTVAASISLPQYLNGFGTSPKRFRDTSTFTLSQDGVYHIKVAGNNAEGDVYEVRLHTVQTDARKTVIHVPLMCQHGATSGDNSGIGGPDLYRTTSTVYVPDGLPDATPNFIYFKYNASEWDTIDECILEIVTDGFAAFSYGILYDRTADATIAASEIVHDNAPGHYESASVSFDPALLTDGHTYSLRVKSSTGSANAFFIDATLHMVLNPGIKGTAYFRCGNGNPSEAKSLPFWAGQTFYEVMGRESNGNEANLLDSGTSDNTDGPPIPASNLNFHVTSGDVVQGTDDFNRPDGTDSTLNGGPWTEPWSAGASYGNASIFSHQLKMGLNFQIYYHNNSTVATKQFAQMVFKGDFVSPDSVSGAMVFQTGFATSVTDTIKCYMFGYGKEFADTHQMLRIFRNIPGGGGSVQIGSTYDPGAGGLGIGAVVRIDAEVLGDTTVDLTVSVNGSPVITVNDNSVFRLNGGGKFGIMVRAENGTGYSLWDDFAGGIFGDHVQNALKRTSNINADMPLGNRFDGDGNNGSETQAVILAPFESEVVPDPTITSNCPLPSAQENVPYSFQLVATGGAEPYIWSITSGSLPTGLTMDSSGLISGTPTVSGGFSITVQVLSS